MPSRTRGRGKSSRSQRGGEEAEANSARIAAYLVKISKLFVTHGTFEPTLRKLIAEADGNDATVKLLLTLNGLQDAAYDAYTEHDADYTNYRVVEKKLALLTSPAITASLGCECGSSIKGTQTNITKIQKIDDDYYELRLLLARGLLKIDDNRTVSFTNNVEAYEAIHDGWAMKTLQDHFASEKALSEQDLTETAKKACTTPPPDGDKTSLHALIWQRKHQFVEYAYLGIPAQQQDQVTGFVILHVLNQHVKEGAITLEGLNVIFTNYDKDQPTNTTTPTQTSNSNSPKNQSNAKFNSPPFNAPTAPTASTAPNAQASPSTGGGAGKPRVFVCGRTRVVHQEGRAKYVRYQNKLILLSEARRLEQQAKKTKAK